MTIGSLFCIAVGAILKSRRQWTSPALSGVILVILTVGFALGLRVLLVVLFFIGSRPNGASGPDRYPRSGVFVS